MCTPCDAHDESFAAPAVKVSGYTTKLRHHDRMCHFHIKRDGKLSFCPSCAHTKGVSAGHAKVRPEELKPTKNGEQLDCDFVGPFPQSIEKSCWCLIIIDSYGKWVEAFPCDTRDKCGSLLERWCELHGTPCRVRSDNAKEFKENMSSWRIMCRGKNVIATFSPPYHPAMNGLVERTNRTILGGMRAALWGCDQRLWDRAIIFAAMVWVRIPRVGNSGSIYKRVRGRDPSLRLIRRFGCLCFEKVQVDVGGKLADRFYPAVYLGMSRENSTFVVGRWHEDRRCRSGLKWDVSENLDVHSFVEDYLIDDIDRLKPNRVRDLFADVKRVLGGTVSQDTGSVLLPPQSVVPPLTGLSGSGAQLPSPSLAPAQPPALQPAADSSSLKRGSSTVTDDDTPSLPQAKRQKSNSASSADSDFSEKNGVCKEPKNGTKTSENFSEVFKPKSENASSKQFGTSKRPSGDVSLQQPSGDGIVVVKRGRPKGSKNKPDAKKTGPKSGRAKLSIASKVSFGMLADSLTDPLETADVTEFIMLDESPPSLDDILLDGTTDFDPADETVVAYTIQLTRKQAFAGPDSVKFLEADALERFQLETLGCWRPVTASDLKSTDEVVPSVVIYTKKRCGRCKARLVALGNRQSQVVPGEIYSPVISSTANRFVAVASAANGYYIESFDISNAFIRSHLNVDPDSPDEERIFVRLPPQWSQSPKGDLVRLLRSLYGLRVSPRKWYDTYSAFLLKTGWERHDAEPGLWRRGSLLLSMYVDDTLLAGPNQSEVEAARQEILSEFSGKLIEPKTDSDGNQVWDLNGVNLTYNRNRRYMRLDMEPAIRSILKKFRMEGCKPVATPCVSGDLSVGETDESYPLRSLVGSLLYVANQARPDISWAVQRVARQISPSATTAAVLAGKRIVKYLAGTMKLGVTYAPSIEKSFYQNFNSILEADPECAYNRLGETVAFSDADFGGCPVTFKSHSGSVCYFRGVPVCWKAQRQSIKSFSTCESEYIALYDTLRLIMTFSFRDWFQTHPDEEPILFGDNKSSLTVGKSSVATKKSKHFMLRYSLVKDHCKDLAYVPTKENRANCLTKPAPRSEYIELFGPELYNTLENDCEEEEILEFEESNLMCALNVFSNINLDSSTSNLIEQNLRNHKHCPVPQS